jgi:WD40 repeat protein
MLNRKISAPFNCDSVEVSPSKDKVFVGMYQYEETTMERGGGYLLLDNRGEIISESKKEYGCLDAQWLDDEKIIVACSDGILRVIDVEKQSTNEVPIVSHPSTTDTQNITMTVDTVSNVTAAISAKGVLTIVKEFSSVFSSWQAHAVELESWCCDLNSSATMVASGSDDCCLKLWDARSGELIHNDRRTHSMGVTCLEFISEHFLLSGSYDDRIRKFDLRNMSTPIFEYRSIGGIWRLKPEDDILLVAACYGGCDVLRMEESSLKPIREFKGHESMAYGIGCLGAGEAVSCSFYDRSIQFWSFD